MANYLTIDGIPLSYNIVADSDDIIGVSTSGLVTGITSGNAAIDISATPVARISVDVIENPAIYFNVVSSADDNSDDYTLTTYKVRAYQGAIPQFVDLDNSKKCLFTFEYYYTVVNSAYSTTRNTGQWDVTDHTTGEHLDYITLSIPSSPVNGQVSASVWDNFYGYPVTTDIDITPVIGIGTTRSGKYSAQRYSFFPWIAEVN